MADASDQYALARVTSTGELTADYNEPIAEHNFNRKKMLQLEQGIGSLQKAARQHTEVVSQIESGMKAMISDTDLRRAIGLAFQEFEHRLEDAFQDSNRKCLQMFSRRDEVQELQALISRKVNWAEYNALLKKMADLRSYIDTMADSIFIGHREALNGEFAKKADRETVEQALKLKADNDDVNEVRARLERLEVLVAHTDARQSAAVEALQERTHEQLREQSEKLLAMINENVAAISDLKANHSASVQRLTSAESAIASLGSASEKLKEVQQALKARQEQVVLPAIAATKEQLARLEAAAQQAQQDLHTLEANAADFRKSSERTVKELSAQVKASKDHVEFLLQETDMIKRRSKETAKKQTTGFQELTDEQAKLVEQLQAIERDMKRQSRDVRAIENRTAKSYDDAAPVSALAGLRALPLAALPPHSAPELTSGPADPPNDRLRGLLEQLERLGAGGPPHEQLGIPYNPERPPLPLGGARQSSEDPFRAPRFNVVEPAPIDSARGAGYVATVQSVRGMYGLSPRMSPSAAKAVKKKR